MKQSRIFATGLAVLAGAALTALPANAQYFKGKTITVLVGYSPGGGADTQSRLLTPYLAGHVPGNPRMIVKNMTGGGGTK
ncbi:MAG: tricarboxylate transporter, partial [Rhodospirillaceae bacterium]|nr:tricarboxylate transporter [Rhodospirillaceae bacterium]